MNKRTHATNIHKQDSLDLEMDTKSAYSI